MRIVDQLYYVVNNSGDVDNPLKFIGNTLTGSNDTGTTGKCVEAGSFDASGRGRRGRDTITGYEFLTGTVCPAIP